MYRITDLAPDAALELVERGRLVFITQCGTLVSIWVILDD